ncbi:DegT/DnrJ/EryC1/StrS family aminotransferase [Turicibacter sanguinis]|uniref:DegT/DnrJ/EryC1/StrS family aminotransferase n=1 Tax=Turicibacter sanguinis TaxID=154288 RepID=UPI00399A2C09
MKPMHLQPIFKDYPYYMDDNQSVSEDVFNRVCLPSDTKMTIEEQEYVIEIIKSLFKGE